MMDTLSAPERQTLEQFSRSDEPAIARRAQIILLSGEGHPPRAIAERVGLGAGTVRRWQRAWAQSRLAIFPASEIEPAPGEARPGVTAPRLPLELRETVGLLPGDPLAEAGRKVLRYHFERMLLHEPGTRQGADIEALHDMRVATRRMRSAFRLFRPAYTPKATRRFREELPQIAGALGVVRDLDVALEKLDHYAGEHPDADLGPLRTQWQDRREAARAALIAELDGKRFARFVKHFDRFLSTPGAGVALDAPAAGPTPNQIRHTAPLLIAAHYAQVRAYEPVVPGAPIATLHALRIEFKRLRYTLEFFEEVLGPEARRVIKAIKRMQDHLGDLHDADVAVIELSALLDAHEAAYSGTPAYARPDLTGIYDYLAAQLQARQHLLDSFPEAWADFLSDEVRRDLALALAAL